MKSLIAISLFALALAACDIANAVVEETTRDVAKGAVNTVVQQQFPGIDAAPYTDCIIENATVGELFDLAQSAVGGVGEAAVATVLTIARRPATSQCIAQSALLAVLG